MSTNTSKPVKSSPLADAVAGEPAAGGRKTKPKSPKSAASSTAEDLTSAAKQQAKADAAAILRHAEQIYAAELQRELRSLMGGPAADYFRTPIESWTLPDTPDSEQLANRTIDALPSAG